VFRWLHQFLCTFVKPLFRARDSATFAGLAYAFICIYTLFRFQLVFIIIIFFFPSLHPFLYYGHALALTYVLRLIISLPHRPRTLYVYNHHKRNIAIRVCVPSTIILPLVRGASRLSGITSRCIWRGERRGRRYWQQPALQTSTQSLTKCRRIELKQSAFFFNLWKSISIGKGVKYARGNRKRSLNSQSQNNVSFSLRKFDRQNCFKLFWLNQEDIIKKRKQN